MRNNRTWANLVPYLLMLPILIFLTSTAMRGNNIAMTYGQFVELLNRKDAQIEQVQLTLSNTVIDVKGIYTDKNGEKGFQVTLPNTETVNNGLVTTQSSDRGSGAGHSADHRDGGGHILHIPNERQPEQQGL